MSWRRRDGCLGAAVALVVAASACKSAPPREGQFVLVVRTDAPLPSADDAASPALFDRLEVALFVPGSAQPCAGCVDSFALDRAAVDEGRASFGVVIPERATGYRLRLTLYPARGLAPRAASSIASTIGLPPVEEGDLRRGHVTLQVKDVGAPAGTLDEPLPFVDGDGPALAPWTDGAPRGCGQPPGADEACVPGRAYWMGDPLLDVAALLDEGGRVEHLVVVDPFFLDAAEVTVARFRASGLAARDELGKRYDPADHLGPGTSCTYRDAPSPSDELPVNCISHDLAAQYCAALGKRLPTEAELALVEGGLESRMYVWGSDPPGCQDAVFGRSASGECSAMGAGPQVAGSGARDRLDVAVGTSSIVDLAGNVSEWVQDLWNRDDEACFPAGILTNPRCDTPSAADGPAWLVRGGSWMFGPFGTRGAVRHRVAYDRGATKAVSDGIGFRCARAAGK